MKRRYLTKPRFGAWWLFDDQENRWLRDFGGRWQDAEAYALTLAGKAQSQQETGLPLTAGQKAAATRRRNLADQIGGAS